MKLTKISEIEDFLKTVNESSNDVWLMSRYGDKYNLKSLLTQYIAIGALLSDKGDELELFCASKEDEGKFLKFFNEHPGIVKQEFDF